MHHWQNPNPPASLTSWPVPKSIMPGPSRPSQHQAPLPLLWESIIQRKHKAPDLACLGLILSHSNLALRVTEIPFSHLWNPWQISLILSWISDPCHFSVLFSSVSLSPIFQERIKLCCSSSEIPDPLTSAYHWPHARFLTPTTPLRGEGISISVTPKEAAGRIKKNTLASLSVSPTSPAF